LTFGFFNEFYSIQRTNFFFAHLEITFPLINILNMDQSIASLSSQTSPSSLQISGQFTRKLSRVLSDTEDCLVSEFFALKGNPPFSEDSKVDYRFRDGLCRWLLFRLPLWCPNKIQISLSPIIYQNTGCRLMKMINGLSELTENPPTGKTGQKWEVAIFVVLWQNSLP